MHYTLIALELQFERVFSHANFRNLEEAASRSAKIIMNYTWVKIIYTFSCFQNYALYVSTLFPSFFKLTHTANRNRTCAKTLRSE
jgi:hypothetical protein